MHQLKCLRRRLRLCSIWSLPNAIRVRMHLLHAIEPAEVNRAHSKKQI